MLDGFKIEVLYFAGRRRFMQLNLPIILDNPLIDCVNVLCRCRDPLDDIWISNWQENLAGHRTEKLKLSRPSGVSYEGHYANAIEENTIYIKIDDDVAYIHPVCIQKVLEARLKYKDAKLIYPNIYNNLMIDFIRDKGCASDHQLTAQEADEIYGYWKSTSHAEYEHGRLLETSNLKETNECFVLKGGFLNSDFLPFKVGHQIRNSINVICFFGKDMKDWIQKDHIDFAVDEYAFTHDVHKQIDSYSVLVKDAICDHFSYYTQKMSVESQNLILKSFVKRLKSEYENFGEIKYDDTTIISNSCFGGHYDQIVFREHNTPFTWCSISSDNYFKLIENIDTLDLETINSTSIQSSFKTTGNDEISWQPFVRLNVSMEHIDIDFIHIHGNGVSRNKSTTVDRFMDNPEQYAIACWNRRLARFNRDTTYQLVITDCVRFNWTIEQLEWFKNLKTRHRKFFITSDQRKLDFFKNSSVVPIKMKNRRGDARLVGCAKDFIDVKKYLDLDVVNFVCTHEIGKDKIPFHLHFYNGKVIQGGSVNGRIPNCDFYDDDVWVSKYNPYINEMTAIYWIGKHLAEFSNKFLGIMHYRRGFKYDVSEFRANRIICSAPASRRGVLKDLASWHRYKNPVDFYKGLPLPKEKIDGIIKTLSEAKTFYNFNMFIADRRLFKEYIDFITPLIEHACKILDSEIDSEKFKSLPDNEKRFYGFCLERLTTYWIESQKRNGIELLPRYPVVIK